VQVLELHVVFLIKIPQTGYFFMLCPILSVEQDAESSEWKSISTKHKDGLFPVHVDSPFSEQILS